MKTFYRWCCAALCSATLLLVACGGEVEEPAATAVVDDAAVQVAVQQTLAARDSAENIPAVPTASPTSIAPPTATTVVEQEEPGVDLEQLTFSTNADGLALNSAEMHIKFEAKTNDQTSSYSMRLLNDFTHNAMSMVSSGYDSADPDSPDNAEMQMVVIADSLYIIDEMGDCFAMVTGDGPMDDMASAFDDPFGLNDIKNLKRGTPFRTMVNGYNTYHYVLPDDHVYPYGFGTTLVRGDIYVYEHPVAGPLVVHSEVIGTAQENPFNEQQGLTDVVYSYDLMRIDEPLEISVPDGCETPNSAEWPQHPNGELQAALQGMTNYIISDTAVEDVAVFYKEALAADGWDLVSENTLGLFMLEFAKDERVVTFNLIGDGADTVVTIFE